MEPGYPVRRPSGLFPAGPPRPTYREPHPVRLGAVVTGAGVAAAWLLLFGLLANSHRGYVWLTLVAGLVATVAALVLARFGDRGVAVGVAASTGIGVSIAMALVIAQWIATGWPLW